MRIAGLLALAILILPISAHAALVNINTAEQNTLESLPHIGEATAKKIISYRETNGPYQTIEDIRKASSYISETYYADIAPLITVGDMSVVNNSNTSDTSNTASSTQDTSVSAEDTATYVPPPSALTLDAGANQDAVMEVPLHLFARVAVKGGAVDPNAQILWGFGDGSSAEGSVVEKTYRYAGTYLIVVTATDGQATGRDEFIVTVRPAQVRILEIPDTGIVVTNDTNERLDLSGWALFANKGSFRIPNGTVLLPKANVLFSSAITKLPTAPEVMLAYPNGGIAAWYAFSPEPIVATTSASTFDTQLSQTVASYEQVQEVEPPAVNNVKPIINTKTNIQTHEETVGAPTASTELAAVGAMMPKTSMSSIFYSPWTLGLLGVIAVAGGIFILL